MSAGRQAGRVADEGGTGTHAVQLGLASHITVASLPSQWYRCPTAPMLMHRTCVLYLPVHSKSSPSYHMGVIGSEGRSSFVCPTISPGPGAYLLPGAIDPGTGKVGVTTGSIARVEEA